MQAMTQPLQYMDFTGSLSSPGPSTSGDDQAVQNLGGLGQINDAVYQRGLAKIRNREAQKRFRERQKSTIEQLRAQVDGLNSQVAEQAKELKQLRTENALLRHRLHGSSIESGTYDSVHDTAQLLTKAQGHYEAGGVCLGIPVSAARQLPPRVSGIATVQSNSGDSMGPREAGPGLEVRVSTSSMHSGGTTHVVPAQPVLGMHEVAAMQQTLAPTAGMACTPHTIQERPATEQHHRPAAGSLQAGALQPRASTAQQMQPNAHQMPANPRHTQASVRQVTTTALQMPPNAPQSNSDAHHMQPTASTTTSQPIASQGQGQNVAALYQSSHAITADAVMPGGLASQPTGQPATSVITAHPAGSPAKPILEKGVLQVQIHQLQHQMKQQPPHVSVQVTSPFKATQLHSPVEGGPSPRQQPQQMQQDVSSFMLQVPQFELNSVQPGAGTTPRGQQVAALPQFDLKPMQPGPGPTVETAVLPHPSPSGSDPLRGVAYASTAPAAVSFALPATVSEGGMQEQSQPVSRDQVVAPAPGGASPHQLVLPGQGFMLPTEPHVPQLMHTEAPRTQEVHMTQQVADRCTVNALHGPGSMLHADNQVAPVVLSQPAAKPMELDTAIPYMVPVAGAAMAEAPYVMAPAGFVPPTGFGLVSVPMNMVGVLTDMMMGHAPPAGTPQVVWMPYHPPAPQTQAV